MEFIEACKKGDLDEAIRLHNLGADIHAEEDQAFKDSCRNGKFEIAKWLRSLGVTAHDNHACVWSCKYGQLETAQLFQNMVLTFLTEKI